jgi:cell division protein FtsB
MNVIKLPAIFRNFFFVTTLIFVLWMCFLDTNDVYTQYLRQERLQKLEHDKVYYNRKIKEVSREYQNLFDRPAVLEKFAREKYYLAKPKEDVFVIVEDTTKKL